MIGKYWTINGIFSTSITFLAILLFQNCKLFEKNDNFFFSTYNYHIIGHEFLCSQKFMDNSWQLYV